TVDHLKAPIKRKKAVSLGDVDADMLILWHVAIPVSDGDDDDDHEVPVYIDNRPKKEKKKLKATVSSKVSLAMRQPKT
ncbi:hypothetical protein BGX21_000470, partial [Mortierella sp. AD011]